ncbi:fused MFS/spermidine synthase [Bosea sp. TWI1241]|uniref:fused MFS/spermidine synthase n=1 Tax=Bosea sp. TWI1241 TaxID=3148904 RepID=UPI00320A6B44
MIPLLLLAEALVAFCALAFETATARLVAPFAGMSTDSWTAIIAGFLFSWAIGNHLGGLLGAGAARRRLGLAAAGIAAGALAVALTPALLPALDALIVAPDPTARWRLALFCALPTLAPGLLFGLAPPLLMTAIIAAAGGRGGVVGLAIAAGAAGSAAGAIAVLWLALDQLGARGTSLAIAALGFATALLVLGAARLTRRRVPA